MLYYLLKPFILSNHLANLFHYISFRSIFALLVSFLISIIFGKVFIKKMRIFQKYGQPIRKDGPQTHIIKEGTPTMGGILIIFSILFSSVLIADLSNKFVWIAIYSMVSFGILGFIDDYNKVVKRDPKGISARMKFALQFAFSIPASIAILLCTNEKIATIITFPIFKDFLLDIGIFYVLFSTLTIISSSNAVNLTDGLDGLATVPIAMVAACFGIVAYFSGNSFYSDYLKIFYIKESAELVVICGSIIGAAIGFLWFNSQPAEIFMGDTGSLSMGALLASISVMTKHEFFLVIFGMIFVLETLSVIIQVYYFRASGGKRIFKMAPLHHHFEKCGWPESKVVSRFWILSVIFAVIGISLLKIR
jgi:phospho-N-acetylmuramoyl-pentapeptide-transferase